MTQRPMGDTSGNAAADAAMQQQDSLLVTVHRLLRGRYVWAIILALLLGIFGAAAGYFNARPVYRGAGLIRVEPNMPRILFPADQETNLPLFDAYVESQASMLRSRDVIEQAMTDQDWRQALMRRNLPSDGYEPVQTPALLSWMTTPVSTQLGLYEFTQNLEVTHLPRTELIEVAYYDYAPSVAAAGVTSVIQAYMDKYVNADANARARKLEILRQRQVELTEEIDLLTRRMQAVGGNLGPIGYEQLYLAKLGEVGRLEAELRQAREGGQLISRVQATERLHEQAQREAQEIGQTRSEVQKISAQLDQSRTRLAETATRIEQLEVESQSASRILVISSGDYPIAPFSDRRLKLSVFGGTAGLSVGLGVFLLLGLIDQRMRSSDDTRVLGDLAALGVLPALPRRLRNAQKAELGAHCIHQTRALTQSWVSEVPQPALAITSAAAGDGKTSLALAMGISFARAGCRTLLIDCDLVGGGLTSRLSIGKPPRLERILIEYDMISRQHLDSALRIAGGKDHDLGDVLVELGHLKPQALSDALLIQERTRVGLVDVVGGDSLDACICEVDEIPNLHVLPTGMVEPHHVSGLSRAAIRQVITEARERFDIILIDSGPTPGSVEAGICAAEADAVVLVVSAGTRRPVAEKALEHLTAQGARVGVVYNRAARNDVEPSTTRSTLAQGHFAHQRGFWARRQRHRYIRTVLSRCSDWGPMAAAVKACSVPPHASGKLLTPMATAQ